VLCKYEDGGAKDCCPAYASNINESFIQYILNGWPYIGDVDETPYGAGKDSINVVSIPPDKYRKIFYFSFRIDPDEWIKPEKSSVLDGCGGLKVEYPEKINFEEPSDGNLLLNNIEDHDLIIHNKKVFRLVLAVLNAAKKQSADNL
jgi:hypothetical protein